MRLAQVDLARFTEHQRNLFDEHWRSLAVGYRYPRPPAPPTRPSGLQEMLEIAQELVLGFEFARVDLYQYRGQVLFGEVTHYPEGGSAPFDPRDFDRALGELWRHGEPLDERFYDHR